MIIIKDLVKSYGGGSQAHQALKGISVDVPAGQIVTFLGPSGCGKSTTLRCIAGLEMPDSGLIQLGDRVVFDSATRTRIAPEGRGLGMVFQSYAIWPHMTVAQNVAYPLQNQRMSRSSIRDRVNRAISLVGLDGLEGRYAPNLSGGQQQRVALARAIVAEPEVLLLDEPLSNLDAKLRDEMRIELRELQSRLGVTMCFVTHDQAEALALSDLIVLMRDGVIVESGTPKELYETPTNAYTAGFFGSSNVLSSEVVADEKTSMVVRNAFGTFRASSPQGALAAGASVDHYFRRNSVRLEKSSRRGELGIATARVEMAVFLGDSIQVDAHADDQRAILSFDLRDGVDVSIGDEISYSIDRGLVFAAGSSPAADSEL